MSQEYLYEYLENISEGNLQLLYNILTSEEIVDNIELKDLLFKGVPVLFYCIFHEDENFFGYLSCFKLLIKKFPEMIFQKFEGRPLCLFLFKNKVPDIIIQWIFIYFISILFKDDYKGKLHNLFRNDVGLWKLLKTIIGNNSSLVDPFLNFIKEDVEEILYIDDIIDLTMNDEYFIPYTKEEKKNCNKNPQFNLDLSEAIMTGKSEAKMKKYPKIDNKKKDKGFLLDKYLEKLIIFANTTNNIRLKKIINKGKFDLLDKCEDYVKDKLLDIIETDDINSKVINKLCDNLKIKLIKVCGEKCISENMELFLKFYKNKNIINEIINKFYVNPDLIKRNYIYRKIFKDHTIDFLKIIDKNNKEFLLIENNKTIPILNVGWLSDSLINKILHLLEKSKNIYDEEVLKNIDINVNKNFVVKIRNQKKIISSINKQMEIELDNLLKSKNIIEINYNRKFHYVKRSIETINESEILECETCYIGENDLECNIMLCECGKLVCRNCYDTYKKCTHM